MAAALGLLWASHGAATGLPRALMGLSWGFMGLSWDSHVAPMGLPSSFHAAPDGAVMELLCGFSGPPVWVVWECRYVGCILRGRPPLTVIARVQHITAFQGLVCTGICRYGFYGYEMPGICTRQAYRVEPQLH